MKAGTDAALYPRIGSRCLIEWRYYGLTVPSVQTIDAMAEPVFQSVPFPILFHAALVPRKVIDGRASS